MQASPLQLNNYFFPHVELTANPEWVSDPSKGRPLVNCTPTMMTLEEENSLYQVSLDLSINSTPENPSQYIIKLIAIGFFSLQGTFPDKEKYVEVSGASILYGAAREYLLQLMNRGPWPPLILHATSFAPKMEKQQPNDKATSSTTKTKN